MVEILIMQNPPKENSLNTRSGLLRSSKYNFFCPPLKTNELLSLVYHLYILASPSFQTHTLENFSGSLLFRFPLHPVSITKVCRPFCGSVSNPHLSPAHLHFPGHPCHSLSSSLPRLSSPPNTSLIVTVQCELKVAE